MCMYMLTNTNTLFQLFQVSHEGIFSGFINWSKIVRAEDSSVFSWLMKSCQKGLLSRLQIELHTKSCVASP